jgi:hypothetical protein
VGSPVPNTSVIVNVEVECMDDQLHVRMHAGGKKHCLQRDRRPVINGDPVTQREAVGELQTFQRNSQRCRPSSTRLNERSI